MTKTQRNLMIGGGIAGAGFLVWWFFFRGKKNGEVLLPQESTGYGEMYQSQGQTGQSLPETGESSTTTSALDRARKRTQPGQRTIRTPSKVRSPSALRSSSALSSVLGNDPSCPGGVC
jgi:hypothetical protein